MSCARYVSHLSPPFCTTPSLGPTHSLSDSLTNTPTYSPKSTGFFKNLPSSSTTLGPSTPPATWNFPDVPVKVQSREALSSKSTPFGLGIVIEGQKVFSDESFYMGHDKCPSLSGGDSNYSSSAHTSSSSNRLGVDSTPLSPPTRHGCDYSASSHTSQLLSPFKAGRPLEYPGAYVQYGMITRPSMFIHEPSPPRRGHFPSTLSNALGDGAQYFMKTVIGHPCSSRPSHVPKETSSGYHLTHDPYPLSSVWNREAFQSTPSGHCYEHDQSTPVRTLAPSPLTRYADFPIVNGRMPSGGRENLPSSQLKSYPLPVAHSLHVYPAYDGFPYTVFHGGYPVQQSWPCPTRSLPPHSPYHRPPTILHNSLYRPVHEHTPHDCHSEVSAEYYRTIPPLSTYVSNMRTHRTSHIPTQDCQKDVYEPVALQLFDVSTGLPAASFPLQRYAPDQPDVLFSARTRQAEDTGSTIVVSSGRPSSRTQGMLRNGVDQDQYQCFLCSETFARATNLEKHYPSHPARDRKGISVPSTPRGSKKRKRTRTGESEHEGENSLQAKQCDRKEHVPSTPPHPKRLRTRNCQSPRILAEIDSVFVPVDDNAITNSQLVDTHGLALSQAQASSSFSSSIVDRSRSSTPQHRMHVLPLHPQPKWGGLINKPATSKFEPADLGRQRSFVESLRWQVPLSLEDDGPRCDMAKDEDDQSKERVERGGYRVSIARSTARRLP